MKTGTPRYLQWKTPAPLVRPPESALLLRTNFGWTFAGNVAYAAAQWAILVMLAKLGEPEQVGEFALGLAITAPVFLLSDLKLRAVQATDARQEYRFGDYLGLRLITITLALLVVAAIVLLAGYRRETVLVILMLGLAKAFDSLSDILYGLQQQHERMDRVAISRILQGALQLASFGVVVALTGSILWGTAGLVVASGMVTAGYDVRSACLIHGSDSSSSNSALAKIAAISGSLCPRWDIAMLARLAVLTLPLGLAVMLGSLWTYIPRYFIQYFFGQRELGMFAAVGYLMVAGSTVVIALAQSAIPRLAKYHASRNYVAFDTLILRLVSLGALLGSIGLLGAILAGRQLLGLIYRPEYATHADLFIWLMAAHALLWVYTFCGTAIHAMRDFRAQLPIQATSCLMLLMLCFWLIKRYGLLGAAWAMLGANIFEAAAYTSVFLKIRKGSKQSTSVGGSLP